MEFQLYEPDRLMWPGKLGIVGVNGQSRQFGIQEFEAVIAKSKQVVSVPSGRKQERITYFFASSADLGRVELVYQHGYLWPVHPPLAGRAIMEEFVEHLNSFSARI